MMADSATKGGPIPELPRHLQTAAAPHRKISRYENTYENTPSGKHDNVTPGKRGSLPRLRDLGRDAEALVVEDYEEED